MSIEVMLTTLAGLLTTLVGALGGPYLLEARRRRRDDAARQRSAREGPYLAFVESLESLQLDSDLRASGQRIDPRETAQHFRLMEQSRSRIDLVGSHATRIWAYRCRLSIAGMQRSLDEGTDEHVHYREKLHEARKEFVLAARGELSIAPSDFQHVRREETIEGHVRWLELEAGEDARSAVSVPYVALAKWLALPDADGQHGND